MHSVQAGVHLCQTAICLVQIICMAIDYDVLQHGSFTLEVIFLFVGDFSHLAVGS